nr:MAG TPA: hypothetical protein [Caudoviricetes sp.]
MVLNESFNSSIRQKYTIKYSLKIYSKNLLKKSTHTHTYNQHHTLPTFSIPHTYLLKHYKLYTIVNIPHQLIDPTYITTKPNKNNLSLKPIYPLKPL